MQQKAPASCSKSGAASGHKSGHAYREVAVAPVGGSFSMKEEVLQGRLAQEPDGDQARQVLGAKAVAKWSAPVTHLHAQPQRVPFPGAGISWENTSDPLT